MKRSLGVLTALTVFSLVACQTSPLGRKQLIMVPDSQMNDMGSYAFSQMKAQTPTDSDPRLNNYVKCVATPITHVAAPQTKVSNWEIVVFKDETANAFALPGGKIGVHTGILKVAKTDAQLAAVLGHEVGHVIAKHGAERVSQGMVTQLGLSAVDAVLAGKTTENKALMLGLMGLVQFGVVLPYSRTQESEADLIGLDLMSRAGFDPHQSVELWRNMIAAGGKGPPEFLSTHPANETRIHNLEAHIPEEMPKYEQARAGGLNPHCQL